MLRKRIGEYFIELLSFDRNVNIRQKLIIVFIAFTIATGLLGLVSYYNLVRVEEKILVVESADDISNIILEIRRYEKNYFLYSSQNDYMEAIRYIKAAFDLMTGLRPSIEKLNLNSRLNTLINELNIYKNLFLKIKSTDDLDYIQKEILLEKLRDSGHALITLSKSLVSYERKQILNINNDLKDNILLSLVLFFLISLVSIIFIQRKVIRPLGVIERATMSIADGQFEKAKVWNSRDEIQKVMLAFNKMVAELERRQDQLVEAQKLSAIGTLASGIAHQVNNPLNNIATSCQILMEDMGKADSELADKMLANIEKETFRARDIVRGLLEFSRNQESTLAENRLVEVVERSLKLVASQVPPGIEVISQVPGEISFLMDRQRMQELFLNLVLNAVQAIEPEQGTILITALQDPTDRKTIIRIEDSGKGVPEEIRHKIFDPFFTTKEEGKGTGLGLYIVYNIVQKHNGTIQLQNRITCGTRFVIEFPAG